jgi:membrane protein DedA with SNARE-associated domain
MVRQRHGQRRAGSAQLGPNLDISPIAVAAAATTGAIVGGTIAYTIGHRFGMSLFERLGKRLPKHFGPGHVALAKRLFVRWGVLAVFFGRLIPLLRILACPLAGALKMRYPHFVAANAGGALCWAGGMTAVVYYAGLAAERWVSRFGWIALVVVVVCGIAMTLLLRERANRLIGGLEPEHGWETLKHHRRVCTYSPDWLRRQFEIGAARLPASSR